MRMRMIPIAIIMLLIIILVVTVSSQNETRESFAICGKYNLNRVDIWDRTQKRIGVTRASKIMPRTYLLPNDIEALKKDPHKQFILKKTWSGARNGLGLYDNKDKIARDRNKYGIAQVYIKNPLLVNGYKFDVRFFLVVCCGMGVFLYRQGYCGYTNKPFKYEGLDRKRKINQAYAKDSHYDIHGLPRLLKDVPNIKTDQIIRLLITNLRSILTSTKSLCCSPTDGVHIFGIDVEITRDGQPLVLEINSAPTLDFNDPWKKRLVKSMLDSVRARNFYNSHWSKVINA